MINYISQKKIMIILLLLTSERERERERGNRYYCINHQKDTTSSIHLPWRLHQCDGLRSVDKRYGPNLFT